MGLKISAMPLASALTGAESVPVVQGGANRKATTSAVRNAPATALTGYGTGAGGTVTQATNKETAVTLNKPSGKITMVASALAGNSSIYFLLYSSAITRNSIVQLSLDASSVSNSLNYRVEVTAVDNGLCAIRLWNISAGALSEPLAINFLVNTISLT